MHIIKCAETERFNALENLAIAKFSFIFDVWYNKKSENYAEKKGFWIWGNNT